jgi:hypothetical protein
MTWLLATFWCSGDQSRGSTIALAPGRWHLATDLPG